MSACAFALMLAYMLHYTTGVVHGHCGLVETFYTPPVAGLSNVVIEIIHDFLCLSSYVRLIWEITFFSKQDPKIP